jgi:hypothetical protein
MAYPINAPNSSTEASLTGQQDQSDPKAIGEELAQVMAENTELFRLRIFTIGIQELAYRATSRGKQVYRRHRNLSPHSWLRIPLSLSENRVHASAFTLWADPSWHSALVQGSP